MPLSRKLLFVSLIGITACRSIPPTPPAPRLNLIFVTIDTLRADRVLHDVTPNIDRVARGGLRFVNARTVAPLTLPAHTSMMTGQLPPVHGVRLNGVAAKPTANAIASRLRQAGYRTAAVVGAFVLDRRFGLAEGFDVYDDHIHREPGAADRLEAERPANVVVDRAVGLLASMDSTQPWFLWVHLYDPHAPYVAARGAISTESPYDDEVRFADAELGRLLQAVEQRPDKGKAAIVIAGDHGEGLGEHGETTHGMLLFDSTLRIPLVVSAPGVVPGVRSDPVSLIDIAPTLLALAGQSRDESLPGRNVLETEDPQREIYAETDYPMAAGWHPARGLVQGRYKMITSGGDRLFDLTSDQPEQQNLASTRPQTVAAMSARIQELSVAESAIQPQFRSPDSETVARLRALGYVSSTGSSSSRSPKLDAADHTDAWTAFERALSARARGAPGEATTLLAKLSERYPDAPLFESTYARVLAESGRATQALRVLRSLVRRSPGAAVTYHDLAVVARAAGNTGEALRAERAALVIDPALPTAHNGLGLLLVDRKDNAGAVAAFEQAVKLDPTNAQYSANLGNALRELGQFERARQAYEKALERDGSLADAANGLGVILVQQRRASEAVAWFERAVARDAQFVEAQLNLAIALQESGQRDRALAQYRHVERSAPAGAREREAARALRQQLEGR